MLARDITTENTDSETNSLTFPRRHTRASYAKAIGASGALAVLPTIGLASDGHVIVAAALLIVAVLTGALVMVAAIRGESLTLGPVEMRLTTSTADQCVTWNEIASAQVVRAHLASSPTAGVFQKLSFSDGVLVARHNGSTLFVPNHFSIPSATLADRITSTVNAAEAASPPSGRRAPP